MSFYMKLFLLHKRGCNAAEFSSSSKVGKRTMTKLRATAFQIFPKKVAPQEVTSVRRGTLRCHFVEDRQFKPILFQSARIIRTQIYDPNSCLKFLEPFVESVPRKVEPIWAAKKDDSARQSRNHIQAANTKRRGTINKPHTTRADLS